MSENKGEMMTHNIEKRINKLKTSGNPKFKKLDSDIHYLL
ncbi:toxin MazF, partial [Exiguobacterium sp. IPCI3]